MPISDAVILGKNESLLKAELDSEMEGAVAR